MSKPSVSLYHDTRRILDNGKFPVRVRVNFFVNSAWKQFYFTTGISLSRVEWEQVKTSTCRTSDLKDLRKKILAKEAHAVSIIDDAPFIRPETFAAIFSGKQTRSAIIRPLFEEVIRNMISAGQVSSANIYRDSLNAIIEYSGEGVTLNVIDEDFLSGFESWMKKPRKKGKKEVKGRSVTTIGFYLRALRAVFNIAIERRIISSDLYPFGRRRYRIPSKRNPKRAISEADKIKLVEYVPVSKAQLKALNEWRFSYFCSGMNFADMAYLKDSHIKGTRLVYERKKTLTTERESVPLSIHLRAEVLEILKGYDGEYLFGVIDSSMSPVVQRAKIRDWIKKTNKHLKKISEDLGIPRVTTYTARHTAASMMLEKGANILQIRDALGHASVKTTEKYLSSINVEGPKKLAESL